MIPVPDLLSSLVRLLNDNYIAYAIGGSYASSVWGQPRQTHDLDLSIRLDEADAQILAQELEPDYIVNEEEMAEATRSSEEYRTFQLIHLGEAFKIDCFVVRNSGYDEAFMSRARLVEVQPGFHARFVAAEDSVIQKLRWFELGNRISDRQWNDIVQVLEVQKGHLDEAYLDHWANHFGLTELLNEARSQTLAD